MYVESSTLAAAPVSAQNPLRGFSRVSRPPIVRTIRHPPLIVPSAIAEYDANSTQFGTSNFAMYFDAISTPVIMPAVFCASFDPCAKLNAAAESNCSLRKYLSIRDGVELRNSQYTRIISTYADTMPISGAPMIIFNVNGHSPVGPVLIASQLCEKPRNRPT